MHFTFLPKIHVFLFRCLSISSFILPSFSYHISFFANDRSLMQMKKRPAVNFMEVVQKDINAGMRATLIDWLVEVSFEISV